MSVSNPPDPGGTDSNQTASSSASSSSSSSPSSSLSSSAAPKYYFENYFRKKLAIADNLEKQKERRKVQFACKVYCEEPVKANEIFDSLFEAIGETITSKIVGLSPAGSLKTWIFNFKYQNDFNLALNKQIKIKEKVYTIRDANESNQVKLNRTVTLKAVLRFHRLALDTQVFAVKSFLVDQKIAMGSIEVEKEKYREEKLKNIETGVITAKFSFDIKNYQKVIALIGTNNIDQQKCVIQLSGHPPRCLICEQFGHIGKDCPKNKEICPTCNKRGHTMCSLASRFKNINELNEEEKNLESFENESNTNGINDLEFSTGVNQYTPAFGDLSLMDFNHEKTDQPNTEESSSSSTINLNLNTVFAQSLLETSKQENPVNNAKTPIEEAINQVNQDLITNMENFTRKNKLFSLKEIEIKKLKDEKAEKTKIKNAEKEKNDLNDRHTFLKKELEKTITKSNVRNVIIKQSGINHASQINSMKTVISTAVKRGASDISPTSTQQDNKTSKTSSDGTVEKI